MKYVAHANLPTDAIMRPWLAAQRYDNQGRPLTENIHVHTWMVSTHALLTCLSNWAKRMEKDQDRKRSLMMLRGMMKKFVTGRVMVYTHFNDLSRPDIRRVSGECLIFEAGHLVEWRGK